jgi:ribokinase
VNSDDRFDVVGFGALNVDLIYQTDSATIAEIAGDAGVGTETTARPDELHALLQYLERCGTLKSKDGGGQAANTIVALSRMGLRCGYIGAVGDDEEGQFLLDSLGSVDTAGVLRGGRSGICVVMLDETGERTMRVFPNANDTISHAQVDTAYAGRAGFLYLTSFVGDGPLDAQKKLAKELGDSCRIAFDPGDLYSRRKLDELREIIERAAIVLAADDEIESLTGTDYESGCGELLSIGARIVIAKRGKEGTYVASGKSAFETDAPPAEVVDKTGAGDVYAAGFIAGLLRGVSLEECAAFASSIAAKSVTGYGRSQYPDKADVAKLLGGGN